MKVHELIAKLRACDPEADVVVGHEGVEKHAVGKVEVGWSGIAYRTLGRRAWCFRIAHREIGGWPVPRVEQFERVYPEVRDAPSVVVVRMEE